MKKYRTAFWTILVVNIWLIVALGYLVWRRQSASGSQAASLSTPGINMGGSAATNPEGTSTPESPSDNGAQPATATSEAQLAAIQLSPQRLQSIGARTGEVEMKSVQDVIRATGNVEIDEERLSYVQVRFPGWIQKVFADATYQYVRKGQPLFTIYSPDLVTSQQEYLLARENTQLLAKSSVPGVAAGASSLVGAAEERLRQFGIPPSEIARLQSTGKVRREMEIDSPASGYITARSALPNAYVQPETQLYTIADLSTVWVNAQVFQNDVGALKQGDRATVTVDAYPGRVFNGRVNLVLPQVDTATRTVRVRFVFANPGLVLKPGMFVNVQLDEPLGHQLVIPTSGVFQSGSHQIAFIDRGSGNLEPREVQLGAQVGDQFVVLKGLKAGDKIITSANFLIDSESQLQAALGSFAPPPPGAGQGTGVNTSGISANVEFSSQPSPPHKGGNVYRVKLTDNKGAPIAGATVTITFFMPAMPAMGMGAMKSVTTLSDKGGGMYEGQGQLGSGGTWQVTILAQQNGQTLASKQISVDAEGGM